MFIKRKQNLVLIILILTAAFTVLATLSLLKPEMGTVMAQEGDDGDKNEIGNYKENIKNYDLSDIIVTPADAGGISLQSDGSGVEVVPIGAFRNNGNNADDWAHFYINGYIRNTSGNAVCFQAPTYPPDGATLDSFSATLKDNSATGDLLVTLWRVSNTNSFINGAELLAVAGILNFNDPTVVEIMDPSIESGKDVVSKVYSYYVFTCFDPSTYQNVLLYGARVFYTPAP